MNRETPVCSAARLPLESPLRPDVDEGLGAGISCLPEQQNCAEVDTICCLGFETAFLGSRDNWTFRALGS